MDREDLQFDAVRLLWLLAEIGLLVVPFQELLGLSDGCKGFGKGFLNVLPFLLELNIRGLCSSFETLVSELEQRQGCDGIFLYSECLGDT